jgi:predicted GNAT family N-acyltransferase
VLKIALLSREHDRTGFDCGVPELNQFLKSTARQQGEKGMSRTFVLNEDESTILGFYTLTLGEIEAKQLPSRYAKKYPGHGLPAVRLARLAVSIRRQRNGYGELLLFDAIQRTVVIAAQAGITGLFVDAKNEVACTFYEKYGFISCNDKYLQLFLPVATLRGSLPV